MISMIGLTISRARMAFMPCANSSPAKCRKRSRCCSSRPNAFTTRIPAKNSTSSPACRVDACATRRPASRAFRPSLPIGIAPKGRNNSTNSVSCRFNANSSTRMLRIVNGSLDQIRETTAERVEEDRGVRVHPGDQVFGPRAREVIEREPAQVCENVDAQITDRAFADPAQEVLTEVAGESPERHQQRQDHDHSQRLLPA